TYFAADVAHYEDTLRRGFERLINVLGSDHHGYTARLKAAIAALGEDPERLEFPMLQFVHIVEDGGRASMSKRRGDFVTLDELIKKLLAFPGEVAEAAAKRAPHRMATYALELAQAFTAFYRDCRVVGAEPEALESFRIALSVASQRTIARGHAQGDPERLER